MSKFSPRALACAAFTAILVSSPAFASDPLQVVVTADRSDVPLKNTGSAITVITSDEIDKYGSKNIADILRTVPGVTIAETGGLGGATKVQLRGASPGSSMVLIDGVRVSDASNTEGYFDFGNFSAANIDRIEILRGPQSALYGSDAMGGVVNIITKKGKRTPVREVTVEAGSYGTFGARGSMSGATDQVTYSFGVNALHSDGFARYGYRVDHPIYHYYVDTNSTPPVLGILPFPPLPKNDPVDKTGMDGNVSYHISDDVTVETGLSYFSNMLRFDNPNAVDPANIYNPGNHSSASILNGYVRSKFTAFDGRLKNQISLFGNQTDLNNYQVDYYGLTKPSGSYLLGYVGKRNGAEYQGDIQTGTFGNFTFGGRRETEYSLTEGDLTPSKSNQTTNSIYAQQRAGLTDRLDVSFGGRVDAIEGGETFPTWRSTAAYRFKETETKLRASVGTGAKAPSLFQRFSSYGTSSLRPETSFGYDAGVDQSFLNGDLTVSATVFVTDYKDKIDFSSDVNCFANCYYNIGSVHSQGIELAMDYSLIAASLHAKFGYTYNDAKDLDKGQQLYRVPKQQAFVSLLYSGIPKWEFEPRATIVGQRLDIFYYSDGLDCFDAGNYYAACSDVTLSENASYYTINVSKSVTLPAYLKLDFLTRYKLDNSNDAYIRFENLTDAHTEDVYNYGSAGRSVYVGWTTRW